jgi:hypothetical protein
MVILALGQKIVFLSLCHFGNCWSIAVRHCDTLAICHLIKWSFRLLVIVANWSFLQSTFLHLVIMTVILAIKHFYIGHFVDWPVLQFIQYDSHFGKQQCLSIGHVNNSFLTISISFK